MATVSTAINGDLTARGLALKGDSGLMTLALKKAYG